MVFCPNGLKLSGVLEEFTITSRFWGSKMQKIYFLKKISVLSAVISNSSTGDGKPAKST